MPDKRPITYPTSFVTSTAVGYADPLGNLSLVASDTPLPVMQTRPVSPAALSGQTTTSTLVGPFTPLRDAPIHLQLSGIWAGTVSVQRSTDGGTTRQALTAAGQTWARFNGNANEVVWQEAEAGATIYLDVTMTSGTLAYRVSQ